MATGIASSLSSIVACLYTFPLCILQQTRIASTNSYLCVKVYLLPTTCNGGQREEKVPPPDICLMTSRCSSKLKQGQVSIYPYTTLTLDSFQV